MFAFPTASPPSRKLTIAVASAAVCGASAAAWLLLRRSRRRPSQRQPSVCSDTSAHQRANPLTETSQPSEHHSSHESPRLSHCSEQAPDCTSPPSAPCRAHPLFKPMSWAVFWDVENTAVPKNVTGSQFIRNLREAISFERNPNVQDAIVRIIAVTNVQKLPVQLRNSLQANGVSLHHVETKGRKDAADKALITELCLFTREQSPPFGIALISGDGDFAYAVARVSCMGYTTIVISPNETAFSRLLATAPDFVIPLADIISAILRLEETHLPLQPPRKEGRTLEKDRFASELLQRDAPPIRFHNATPPPARSHSMPHLLLDLPSSSVHTLQPMSVPASSTSMSQVPNTKPTRMASAPIFHRAKSPLQIAAEGPFVTNTLPAKKPRKSENESSAHRKDFVQVETETGWPELPHVNQETKNRALRNTTAKVRTNPQSAKKHHGARSPGQNKRNDHASSRAMRNTAAAEVPTNPQSGKKQPGARSPGQNKQNDQASSRAVPNTAARVPTNPQSAKKQPGARSPGQNKQNDQASRAMRNTAAEVPTNPQSGKKQPGARSPGQNNRNDHTSSRAVPNTAAEVPTNPQTTKKQPGARSPGPNKQNDQASSRAMRNTAAEVPTNPQSGKKQPGARSPGQNNRNDHTSSRAVPNTAARVPTNPKPAKKQTGAHTKSLQTPSLAAESNTKGTASKSQEMDKAICNSKAEMAATHMVSTPDEITPAQEQVARSILGSTLLGASVTRIALNGNRHGLIVFSTFVIVIAVLAMQLKEWYA